MNRYVDALHIPAEDGLTPFDLIWKAVHGRTTNRDVFDAFRAVECPTEPLRSPRCVARLHGQAEVYAGALDQFIANFGHPAKSPWAGMYLREFPLSECPKLVDILDALHRVATELVTFFERWGDVLGVTTVRDITRILEFERQAGSPPDVGLLVEISARDLDEFQRGLALLDDDKRWRENLKVRGDTSWPSPDQIRHAAELVRKNWFTRLVGQLTPSGRQARSLMHQLGPKSTRQDADALDMLAAHVGECEANVGLIDRVQRILGPFDTRQATAALRWIRLARSSAFPKVLEDQLVTHHAHTIWDQLVEAAHQGAEPVSNYGRLLERVVNEFGMNNLRQLPMPELVECIDRLFEHRAELNDYCDLRRDRNALAHAGLADFLRVADDRQLDGSTLVRVFDTFVAARRVARIRTNTPALANIGGQGLEARRKRFADRDRDKIDHDRRAVKSRLLGVEPPAGSNIGPKKEWTESALLHNELGKQKRFVPVRRLLTRAHETVQTFMPCFMMSPLSLAKYLAPGKVAFDLVVMDEASQMLPEDALGSLLRASQTVVVGDPQQLPPTNFFAPADHKDTADEEFEDVDDESILETCQKSFHQLRLLKWHYRSRCESLIAFSNKEFYKNLLVTFPQPRHRSFSIDLVRVKGAYQARRNVIEAERVAEDAVAFMREFADANAEEVPSLGIVAINAPQCELLQEELRRISAGDPLVERYQEKVETKGEGIFVKNLENVQGDERDYVFITLTYGPEAGVSAMKQRFGPINGKQGHRRLNVLFTRARRRIRLYSSFGSEDVKPGVNSHEGVRVLKQYLEYAEAGGQAVEHRGVRDPDSDFEIEVGDRLRARGFRVVPQVGVSGYSIDLGILHPDKPNIFLAGVECDGAAYHSSKSARDRDRLREEVLRGLGWELVRVWSTDWFDNPDLETDKLVKKLEQLRAKPIEARDETVVDVFGSTEPQTSDGLSEQARQQSCVETGETTPPRRDEHRARTFDRNSPLTENEASIVLIEFRESKIRPNIADWDPQRSILRDSMIETFIQQRISDPEDWFKKVPKYLRTGTNPSEKQRFLDEICEIVDRIGSRH